MVQQQHTILIANIGCLLLFVIGCANAFHNDHPDFIPYKDVGRYVEKEMNPNWERVKKWQELEKTGTCHCGAVKLADMALVYLDRITDAYNENIGQEDVKEPRRYLISKETMGTGNYSKVYHAIPFDEKNANCVAIKIAKAITDDPENGMKELEEEAIKLHELSSSVPVKQHVIELYEILSYEDANGMEKVALVLELGEISLEEYFRVDDNIVHLSEKKFLLIVKQMLLGLNEIHDAGYIYFDMKPGNMLTMPRPMPMPIPSPPKIHHSSAAADVEKWKIAHHQQQVYVKYIDFAGLIKVHLTENAVRWGDQTIITTRKYEAPEMYGTENPETMLTKAFDIWSLGVSIISLLAQTQMFKGQLNEAVYREAEAYRGVQTETNLRGRQNRVIIVMAREVIANNKGTEYPRINHLLTMLEAHFPKSIEIVKKCLIKEPTRRLNAKQLLEFQGILKDIGLSKIYKNSDATIAGTPSSSSPAAMEGILRKIHTNIAKRNAAAQIAHSNGTSSSAENSQQTPNWPDQSPTVGGPSERSRNRSPMAKFVRGSKNKLSQLKKKINGAPKYFAAKLKRP